MALLRSNPPKPLLPRVGGMTEADTPKLRTATEFLASTLAGTLR
jgi:hypothetical protein